MDLEKKEPANSAYATQPSKSPIQGNVVQNSILPPIPAETANGHNISQLLPLTQSHSLNPEIHQVNHAAPEIVVQVNTQIPLKATPMSDSTPSATGMSNSRRSSDSPYARQPVLDGGKPILRTFSWNGDDEAKRDDPYNQKLDTRCSKCIAWYRKWPHFLRTLLYCVSGCSIIMIPGLISYFFFVEKTNIDYRDMKPKNGFAINDIPFFVFSVFLCILWCAWFGLRWAFTVLPEVLVRLIEFALGTTVSSTASMHAGTRISHYIDYLRFLKHYLAFLMWCVTGLCSWTIIFKAAPSGDSKLWSAIIGNIWLNLVFASLVWTIEKFFLQVFSVHFHKRAYAERMKENKFAFNVLEKLNKAKKVKKSQTPNTKFGTIAEDSVWSTTVDGMDGASGFVEKEKAAAQQLREIGTKAADVSKNIVKGLGQVFGAAVGIDIGYSSGIVLRTPQDARKLAKKLFYALCRRPDDLLEPEDFYPYFDNQEEAAIAFAFFDKDNNGDVSKQEMKSAVLEIFRERMAIEKSLRQSSQAIDKLDSLLKSVVCIIILFISLGVWSVDTSKFLAAAVSLWAGLLFAVGGTVKNLVESCIFLFLTHPYDVGDRVEIENTSYTVKEFGLTSTVFRRGDGKEIYAPNIVLASKFIQNIRRSGIQGEDIKITIALNTPPEKIQQLRDHLYQFVVDNGRDYTPKLDINIEQIVDKNSLVLSMFLEHKSNWQDGAKRGIRRNKFMFALKEGIEKFGIKMPDLQELNVIMNKVPQQSNEDSFLYEHPSQRSSNREQFRNLNHNISNSTTTS